MKNLLLVIFAIITLIAILNYFGAVHVLDSHHMKTEMSDSTGMDHSNVKIMDSSRYDASEMSGGGKQVPVDTVVVLMDSFQASCSDPDSTHCVFFSKKALDDIFARDLQANGIICCFGKTAGGHLQIGISGIHSDKTLIDTIADPPTYYIGQTFCPPNCVYPK